MRWMKFLPVVLLTGGLILATNGCDENLLGNQDSTGTGSDTTMIMTGADLSADMLEAVAVGYAARATVNGTAFSHHAALMLRAAAEANYEGAQDTLPEPDEQGWYNFPDSAFFPDSIFFPDGYFSTAGADETAWFPDDYFFPDGHFLPGDQWFPSDTYFPDSTFMPGEEFYAAFDASIRLTPDAVANPDTAVTAFSLAFTPEEGALPNSAFTGLEMDVSYLEPGDNAGPTGGSATWNFGTPFGSADAPVHLTWDGAPADTAVSGSYGTTNTDIMLFYNADGEVANPLAEHQTLSLETTGELMSDFTGTTSVQIAGEDYIHIEFNGVIDNGSGMIQGTWSSAQDDFDTQHDFTLQVPDSTF